MRPELIPAPTLLRSGCMLLGLLSGTCLLNASEPEPAAVRVVFGGDVMLDQGPGHAVANGRDPFAEFDSLLRDADITVCNLECTVADHGSPADKPYTFLARPQCLPVLARYFTAVSVANNHALDYGQSAFLQELELLRQSRLAFFGGGRNGTEARRPLILERNGRRVALLGYNDMVPRSFAAGKHRPGVAWLVEADVLADVREIRRSGRADVVIPYLHWGEELESGPTPAQQAFARRLIDAGADAVVGGHPHVTQTVDFYHGHPVIYSLGNFVFDYFAGDPPVWSGWLIRLSFARSGAVDLETAVFEIDPAGLPHPQGAKAWPKRNRDEKP